MNYVATNIWLLLGKNNKERVLAYETPSQLLCEKLTRGGSGSIQNT